MRYLILLVLSLPAMESSAQIDLHLTPIADGIFGMVTDIRHAGDGSGRLFLATIDGRVLIVRGGRIAEEPFLDIRDRVRRGGERGLLSVAFAPDYPDSGRLYAYYSELSGNYTVIERFTVSADSDRADADSGEVIYQVGQPFSNHNGGRMVFGPDGYLYLGLGDGGGAGDPLGEGQDPGSVLGTLIRFDVAGDSAIPAPDNPFSSDPDIPDEVWAFGLRNPWRISFDRRTGDLYIADVGQDAVEEINVQPASSPGGENYGWSIFEGTACFSGNCPSNSGFSFPVFQYTHDEGCSITGGEVYRGPDYPALDGMYFYGDFCSNNIWGLREEDGQWVSRVLSTAGNSTITFGEDERGNVYVSTDNDVFLISDGVPVDPIPIDGSLSGTYTVDGLNDQGFFVTVGEQPDGTRFLFVTWFTFEAGEPLWLVGVAFFEPDAGSVTVPMERLSGPGFLDIDPATFAVREAFGEMRFSVIDCDTIEADYAFPEDRSGSLVLNRLTSIEGRECTVGAR